MDKEAINKRFIEAVMFIITSGLATNKSDVASSLNISNSKFSEILKERMNVGVDSIAALCIIYKINADWVLTGREDMMLSHSANKNETSILKSILTDKDNKIEQLNRELGRIEAELKMAKEELTLRGGGGFQDAAGDVECAAVG